MGFKQFDIAFWDMTIFSMNGGHQEIHYVWETQKDKRHDFMESQARIATGGAQFHLILYARSRV